MRRRIPTSARGRTAALPLLAVCLAVFSLSLGACRKHEETGAEQAAAEDRGDDIYRVDIGASPVIGAQDAPVTIINFSDFECPFSKRLFEAMERILKERGSDIAYVYKHYPLATHRQSRRAAKAAIAAHQQGRFVEMYRKLFENSRAINEENLLLWARELGLDAGKFETDSRGPDGDRLLQEDITTGNIFGVRGTPTLFINGRRLSGADIPQIERVVDEELAHGKKLLKKGVTGIYAEITKNGRLRYTPPKRPAPVVPKDVYAVERPPHSPMWGPAEAPVTIILFADLECPFSARFQETLGDLKREFEGKLRVVFVNLPLKLHPYAVAAAKAAVAAGRQEKFWEFQERLFADQSEWKKEGANFDQYLDVVAQELKIDGVRFRKDMEDPRTMELIHRDIAFADGMGVRGTPGLFINGRYASGAFPAESFQAVIREELERARPLVGKGLSGDALYFELIRDGRPSLAANRPPDEDPDKVYAVKVSGQEPMSGGRGAAVVIVEFTDFQCAPCAAAAAAVDAIQKEYGSKVAVVFKQFPLARHAQAERAARFALAVKRLAGDDTYRAVRRTLFGAQTEWGNDATGEKAFERYAKEQGLDWSRVRIEMVSAFVRERLADDRSEAARNGVRSVPVLFVNGKKVNGPQPVERLKVIVEEMSREKK